MSEAYSVHRGDPATTEADPQQSRPTADEDDDEIALPADTQSILQEFLREQAERQQAMQAALQAQQSAAEQSTVDDGQPDASKPQEPLVTFGAFEENWQLSQFWYNDRTKKLLAHVCRQCIEPDGSTLNVALLSCPSLFDDFRALSAEHPVDVRLFEFDGRFAAYGPQFVPFDYKLAVEPKYLAEHHGRYDLVVVDPPFLSEECIAKIALIVLRLVRDQELSRVVLNSGRVVSEWAERHLSLLPCLFGPQHERNLGNAFTSYANFDLDAAIGRAKRALDAEARQF